MPVEHSFVWQQTNLIIVSIRILSIHRMLNNNIQLNANRNGGLRTKRFLIMKRMWTNVCVFSNIQMKAEAQDLSSENSYQIRWFIHLLPGRLVHNPYLPKIHADKLIKISCSMRTEYQCSNQLAISFHPLYLFSSPYTGAGVCVLLLVNS